MTRTRSPYLQLRLGEATVIIIQVIETVFSFSRSSSSSSESFKSQLTQFFAADPRAGPPGDNRSLRVCGHSCRVCWVRGVVLLFLILSILVPQHVIISNTVNFF